MTADDSQSLPFNTNEKRGKQEWKAAAAAVAAKESGHVVGISTQLDQEGLSLGDEESSCRCQACASHSWPQRAPLRRRRQARPDLRTPTLIGGLLEDRRQDQSQESHLLFVYASTEGIHGRSWTRPTSRLCPWTRARGCTKVPAELFIADGVLVSRLAIDLFSES